MSIVLTACHVCVFSCRFWKRIVKGAAPPTDLRSGSSLVQLSKTGAGPALSFVDASTINKVPGAGHIGHTAPISGAGVGHTPVNGAGVGHTAPGTVRYQ
jgi:hypothetical protein